VSPGRDAALSVVLQTERGRRLDRAFGEAAGRLEPRERAFAHELSYGVTRLRGRLDHLIARHVKRGLGSVDPTVLELLRLGSYQMLYMGSVPDYAAVSQTVDQVRTMVHAKPAGFANAVLRKVGAAGDGPENFPSETDQFADFLTTWGSHPGWLIDRWLQRWEAPQVRRLVEANNRRPSLNMTPLGTTPSEAVQQLTAAGIEAEEVGAGTASVRLRGGVRASRALEVMPDAIVQDPAANLVSRYADIPPGTIVADLCSAPGGKALALMDRPARIVAADRSESRIHMVRENAHRTGRPVQLVVADALHPPFSDIDAVLLDVPCTGTGTLSRHPDARWRLSEESIDELARLQEDMLASTASVVAPGGLLVYSTCTLEPEENEERIGAFLKAHPDFQMASTAAVPAGHRDLQGCLSVRPQDTGFDGAFAARMRRAQ
jgi:16S rRNA (cytosine967-C5)-methyltransferase